MATTTTRADGTFSVTVKPERNAFRLYMQVQKGTTADGVYKPSDADHKYNVTPEFIITGT